MQDRTAQQRRRLEAHVFVCTQTREEHSSCAAAYGDETLEAVKGWLRDRNAFWSPIGVTETDCLGLCSEGGTALTIQPHDVWYSDVKPTEVAEILTAAFGPEADDTTLPTAIQ